MSFSVEEVKMGLARKGWYKVLSPSQGRDTFTKMGEFDFPSYGGLARSDSSSSLVSVRSCGQDNVRTANAVSGGIRLGIVFKPPARGGKTRGSAVVHLSAARVAASEPYVKMYLSVNDKDVKGTKTKSRVKRNKSRGRQELKFNETLVMDIPPAVQITPTNRLQISVWDHARLRANECVGTFSIALPEILAGDLGGLRWCVAPFAITMIHSSWCFLCCLS